jgi:hypothetical protein
MRALLVSGLAAAALVAGALTSPSFAQTQSNQQVAPGTGGTSKPGVQGLPGSKSGPAAKSGNAKQPTQRAANPEAGQRTGGKTGNPTTMHQDESKVPGKPGSKSGPTAPKQ